MPSTPKTQAPVLPEPGLLHGRRKAAGERATDLASTMMPIFIARDPFAGCVVGMAGRYTGSYLARSNGWRAVATLADIGQASLVGRIPKDSIRTLPGREQQEACSLITGEIVIRSVPPTGSDLS